MRRLRRWLLCLALVWLPSAHAQDAVDACAAPQLGLGEAMRAFEDASGALSLDQAARLPAERFVPLAAGLPRDFTRSAIWLRLELRNEGDTDCHRWLSLGGPRLEDLQVHLLRAGAWQSQRAGSAYPLAEWSMPERQPVFALDFEPGERVLLLARVQGSDLLPVGPVLRSNRALLETQQRVYLVDGVSLGVVLLVVSVGVVSGLMIRSRLLLALSVAVACYMLLACLLNGYLIYLPALLPWSRPLIALASLASFTSSFGYFRILLRMRELPRLWGTLASLYVAVYAACRGYGLLGDPVLGNQLAQWMLVGTYPMVAGALAAGLRRGLRYGGIVWLVVGLLALQFVVRYLLGWEQLPWQSAATKRDLSSSLTGAVLLAFTLMQEVAASRRRERLAQADLEAQRRSEHERLENMVAQRTEQLRDALRARGSLLARISHDLRAPLVSIIDYARLLRERPEPSPDFTRKIEHNARQQLELIDELVEFSREDAQAVEILPTPGYLYAFLREMEEEGQLFAQRQGNEFSCRFAPDLPVAVRADFRRLRQVLFNLFGNAAKFTRNGRIVCAVDRLDDAADGARLAFSVTDSGIGVAPGELEKLMLPFQRGANAGGYAGTGLGLSIVKQLLEGMGSALQLERPEGGGSRFGFVLSLPLADRMSLERAFVETHADGVEGAQRRILLADDVAPEREWLSDLLGGYDFDVTAVQDGSEAWQRLQREEFELLLCDQMMSGLDGWELLERVRAARPDLPVVLYSAAPPRHPRGRDGVNFDAVLLKPAASGKLLSLIDALARPRR